MPLLFAVTLFVSALLLFLVQPMVGKMVLPLLGGTPGVWTTCMVFFQAALLAGYAYAHATSAWLGVRRQIVVHGVLLGLALLVLPISIAKVSLPPSESDPRPWLLLLLTVSVGLPFFVLSASAPLFQKWFASTRHPSARDPYFLYAASNLGSMLALLGYPTLVEPYLPLKAERWISQSWLWTAGYGVLVLLVAACAAVVWRAAVKTADRGRATSEPPPDPRDWGEWPEKLALGRRLRWIALAFVPSSLMLGVTTYISIDIAAVPLFWVIPLALYLLSFILVFSRWPDWLRMGAVLVAPLGILLVIFLMLTEFKASMPLVIGLHLATLFLVALVCHGELARDRPSTRHLTEFYLLMSVGGVLGGVFNALVAPLVFPGIAEYPIALVCACLLTPSLFPEADAWLSRWLGIPWNRGLGILADVCLAACVGLIALGLYSLFSPPDQTGPRSHLPAWLAYLQERTFQGTDWLAQYLHQESGRLNKVVVYGVPTLLCYLLVLRPLRFGLAVGAFLLAAYTGSLWYSSTTLLHQERSFFGVLRVQYQEDYETYTLTHGTTTHGTQLREDGFRTEPMTYYHRTGPIGQAFDSFRGPHAKRNVALVGLGAGTMACYGESGRTLTFYDIDPAVVRIARNPYYFTYLQDCRSPYTIVLGDARLRLNEAPDGQHDVIVLDAFSSDAIPIHLITREAIQLYFRRLAPGGVLAVHISNRYLDLRPVLANLAEDQGLAGLVEYDKAEDNQLGKYRSEWVVLARTREDLGDLTSDPRWEELDPRASVGVWTDDYSNLLGVFMWKN